MTDTPVPDERPERAFPTPNGLVGVGVVVLDDTKEHVLLGLGHDGSWELPGGKVDSGETFEQAACRELAEETALRTDIGSIHVGALLLDSERGITRVTAAALVSSVSGEPLVREPDKIVRWQWFPLSTIPTPLFAPSAAVLSSWHPALELPAESFHCYRTIG